jgi:bacterioferritin
MAAMRYNADLDRRFPKRQILVVEWMPPSPLRLAFHPRTRLPAPRLNFRHPMPLRIRTPDSPLVIAGNPVFLPYSLIMKGNPKVLSELNKALREELTAINQYFLHAEMCENWGYHSLSEYIKKQSIGEMKHAEVLIERILFLDGSPNMQPLQLTVGGNVKQMLDSDLALELSAVKEYNDAVKIATEQGDNGSRDLFVELLKDEEGHVDWLESQVHQIKELGYERYLTEQMGEHKEE